MSILTGRSGDLEGRIKSMGANTRALLKENAEAKKEVPLFVECVSGRRSVGEQGVGRWIRIPTRIVEELHKPVYGHSHSWLLVLDHY
jgi:hypothetical protein